MRPILKREILPAFNPEPAGPALKLALPYVVAAPGLSPLEAFIRLGRFKFLFQSTMVVGLGVTLAVHAGHTFRPALYALALLFVWCTHLMTHYCNEYFDLEADKANASPTSWTGGSRILVDGLLPPSVSLSASFVLLFAAVLIVSAMPTLIARLMAAAICGIAWFYTAPPLRLNYRALGEVSCAAVLYGLAPLMTCYLQADTLGPVALGCVGIVFVLQFLRMSIMNLSDIEGDTVTGKRTLAVRLGAPGLIRMFVLGQVAVYAAVVLLTALRVLPLLTGVAVLATCPVPLWVSRQLLTGALKDPARANGVTFWSSMHMPVTTCMMTLSLLGDLVLGGGPLQVLWFGLWGVSFTVFATWLSRAIGTNMRPARAAK